MSLCGLCDTPDPRFQAVSGEPSCQERPIRDSDLPANRPSGAVSVPLDQLEQRLGSLPRDAEIVAYCRGPYCLLAPRAVELLRERGFRARRLEEGLPEWRLAGLPVAVGEERR